MNSIKGEFSNGDNLEKNKIFSEVMITNNKRLTNAFLAIAIIANLAVTIIKFSGRGSKYLTYTDIVIELVSIALVLCIGNLIAKKYSGTKLSAYVTLTSVVICLWIFQFSFYGASELFAVNYIAIALSVFYFDVKITIYALVLVLVSQTTLFILKPEDLIPGGPRSNLLVRYIVYLMVGIGASTGAGATHKLLVLAIEKQEEASKSFSNIKEMAKAIMMSIGVLQTQSSEQDGISADMNEMSQQQAASLEEISASLEELAANSESISSIARSLFEELDITVESVEDLKTVNDKTQESSLEIYNTLNKVTEYSEESSNQIEITKEKFKTLENQSNEMSNFVQVINDIADKVNLLSLNASIEAARAGDAGKGFAVVADEISKLAEATTHNSKEIEKIINENQSLILDSSKLIDGSSGIMLNLHDAIQKIKKEISDVGTLISDIDLTIKTIKNLNIKVHDSSKTIESSTAEQKVATDESSITMADIAKRAQDVVNFSIRVAESTQEIKNITGELDRLTKEVTDSNNTDN